MPRKCDRVVTVFLHLCYSEFWMKRNTDSSREGSGWRWQCFAGELSCFWGHHERAGQLHPRGPPACSDANCDVTQENGHSWWPRPAADIPHSFWRREPKLLLLSLLFRCQLICPITGEEGTPHVPVWCILVTTCSSLEFLV